MKLALEDASEGNAEEGGPAEDGGGSDGVLPGLSAGQNHGSYREAFRKLVEKNGYENYRAEPGGNQKAGGNGDAVKKRVDAEAEEYRAPGVSVLEFFVMSFFAKMEMRRDGVFEKMDEKETDQNVKEGALAREADGFGKNFDEDDSQHVAGAEREEILQVLTRPFFADYEIAAEQISGGSDDAEEGG